MVIRLAVPDLAWSVAAIAVAGILASAVVVPRWWRRRDHPATIAGELDLRVGADGLAMALAAQPAAERDRQWLSRLEPALAASVPPPLPRQWALGPVIAAICLGVAVMLPQTTEGPGVPVTLLNLFRQAHDKIDAVAEVMTPERKRELMEQVEALERHAQESGMDQATWEGLDRLSAEIASESAEAGKRLTEALIATEAAGDALAEAHNADGGRAEATRLAQALAELAKQAPSLVPVLPAGDAAALKRALAQAVAQGLLTPEQQAALERAGLDPGGAGAEGAAGMDSQQLRTLQERLAKELAEGMKKFGGWDQGEGAGENGRGGVQRGPGHPPLSYETPNRVEVGNQMALPAGARLNADGSVTIAEQARDAELDDASKQALLRAAAQSFDPTAADARRATVSPRHRAAVERYFAAPEATTPPAVPAVPAEERRPLRPTPKDAPIP